MGNPCLKPLDFCGNIATITLSLYLSERYIFVLKQNFCRFEIHLTLFKGVYTYV